MGPLQARKALLRGGRSAETLWGRGLSCSAPATRVGSAHSRPCRCKDTLPWPSGKGHSNTDVLLEREEQRRSLQRELRCGGAERGASDLCLPENYRVMSLPATRPQGPGSQPCTRGHCGHPERPSELGRAGEGCPKAPAGQGPDGPEGSGLTRGARGQSEREAPFTFSRMRPQLGAVGRKHPQRRPLAAPTGGLRVCRPGRAAPAALGSAHLCHRQLCSWPRRAWRCLPPLGPEPARAGSTTGACVARPPSTSPWRALGGPSEPARARAELRAQGPLQT